MSTQRTFPTSSVDFYAEQRGPKPRAVFVHGFAGDVRTWDPLWAQGSWDALRYDLRGFGRSLVKQSVPYTHAEDLLTVFDAAGIEQTDLLGVSMGGAIALNFTLNHPERVRRLVLISPGMVGWEYSESWLQRWNAIETHARNGALDQAREAWWRHPLFDTIRETFAGPALRETIQRYSGDQWVRDSHAPLYPDIERIYELKTPTLLLSGERDLVDYRLIADVLTGGAADMQRVDVDGGHLLHLEDPQTCARHIDAFLQER